MSKEMKFTLKKKEYKWYYLLGFPFMCEPLCTTGVVVQKILTGIVNVLWILAEAKLIDLAIYFMKKQAELQEAVPLLIIMLLIIIWKRMGYNIGRILTRKIEISAQYQLNKESVKKQSRIRYDLLEDNEVCELSRRVLKNTDIWSMLQQTCNFITAVVRVTGVFLIIFSESTLLGIAMIAASVPVICFSVISGKKTYYAWKEASVYARRGEYLQEMMTGKDSAEERTLFHSTEYVNAEWNRQSKAFQKISLKGDRDKEIRNLISGGITNGISTVMVLFFIMELSNGGISIGIFIALSKAVYDIIQLMNKEIGYSLVNMARSVSWLKELTVFANLEEVDGTNEEPAEEKLAFESLELRHVSFCYPNSGQAVIKDMDLILQKGRHYALVGENGAGKTTLIKLLTGLYDNYQGSILLNGRELRTYAPAEIKAVFSNVWQDFARFWDTAGNNMLVGDVRHMKQPEAAERLWNYAKELQLDEDLKDLPQGIDSPLGKLEDRGIDLSGGQWQKIAMVRGLMKEAPVLLLDEPTAALDPISESRLYEEFGKISRGRTSLFISHRLGSTRIADHILVLKNGKIEEEGTHEELMQKGGLYAEMYESQKSWYQEKEERGEILV